MPTPYSVLTTVGLARITNAFILGDSLDITQMAIGDGVIAPDADMTALAHEVWRGALASLEVDAIDPAQIVARVVVPADAGGWTAREAALLDTDGHVIAIGSLAPTAVEAGYVSLTVTMVVAVGAAETAGITLMPAGPYIHADEKGEPGGVATLDGAGTVPLGQLPALPDAGARRVITLTGGAGHSDTINSALADLETSGFKGDIAILHDTGSIVLDKQTSAHLSGCTIDFLSPVTIGPSGGFTLAGAVEQFTRKPSGGKLGIQENIRADSNGRMLIRLRPADQTYMAVGDKITLTGRNDVAGRAVEKQTTTVTGTTMIEGNAWFVCADEPDFAFQPSYTDSDWPADATAGTTISLVRFTGFTADVPKRSRTALVADTTLVKRGDVVLLSDLRTLHDMNPYADDRPYSANMEYVRVAKIIPGTGTAGTIVFDRAIQHDFSPTWSGGITVVKLVSDTHVRFAAVNFLESQLARSNVLQVSYGNRCSIGVEFMDGYNGRWGQAVRLAYCYDCAISSSAIAGALYTALGGEGYGATMYYSTDCRIVDTEVTGGRHNFLLTACTNSLLDNPRSYDDYLSGIDLHGFNNRGTRILDPEIRRSTNFVGHGAGIRIGNPTYILGDHDTVIEGGRIFGYRSENGSSVCAAVDWGAPSSGITVLDTAIEDCDVGFRQFNIGVASNDVARRIRLRATLKDVTTPFAINGNSAGLVDDLHIDGMTLDGCASPVVLSTVTNLRIERVVHKNPVYAAHAASIDITGCPGVVVTRCDAGTSPRGIKLTSCTNARAVQNDFSRTADGVEYVDGGGNTGAVVRDNGSTAGASAAMAPVVQESTLLAARAALGAGAPFPRNSLVNAAFRIPQIVPIGTDQISGATPAVGAAVRWWLIGASAAAGMRVVADDTTGVNSLFVARVSGSSSTALIGAMQTVDTAETKRLAGKQVVFTVEVKATSSWQSTDFKIAILTGAGTDEGTVSGNAGAWAGATTWQDVTCTPVKDGTWQTFMVQGVLPSGATEMAVRIAFTPTGTAATNNDGISIRSPQLELGVGGNPVATEFERKGDSLDRWECLLNWVPWKVANDTAPVYFAQALCNSTTQAVVVQKFPRRMRAVPSGLISAVNSLVVGIAGSGSVASTSISTTGTTAECAVFAVTVASGLTAGQAATVRHNVTAGYLGFSADL